MSNSADQDVDERKKKIEHHKEDQLDKQREGKGHWKRELGSNSESAVCVPFFFLREIWGRIVEDGMLMTCFGGVLDKSRSGGDYGCGA